MRVFINGETKEIGGELNVSQLLRHFSLPEKRIAVELNKEVIRRRDWENILVRESDRIEIVHFVGGG
ncbi:MAG: sulfur carrier protein ThiS [Pyrinomonadaceae bacterium]